MKIILLSFNILKKGSSFFYKGKNLDPTLMEGRIWSNSTRIQTSDWNKNFC